MYLGSTVMSNIESLTAQITQLASTADLSVRHQLSGQLQRLARSIATPRQIMQNYGYMYTEQVMARVAADLNIFSILSESAGPMKTTDVARRTGADAALTDRILRHLASNDIITEVSESTFEANDTTHILATPAGTGNIMFGFNSLNPSFQALPDFLKANGYRNPNQHLDTAFHQVVDTKDPYFVHMQQDQETIRHFYPSLSAFESPTSWTAVVPLIQKLENTDARAPLFVDIGGGHGFQCAAFRKAVGARFPGRVINQDLPRTLAQAPQYDDVEMMAQDFYAEQQVKGASIYYIRQCLHDVPDEDAKRILSQIRDAMSPQSILLIDELVIPDTGASRFSMQLDATMMAMLASAERTLPSWRRLLGVAGLEIQQVYQYDTELEYSIIEAVVVKT